MKRKINKTWIINDTGDINKIVTIRKILGKLVSKEDRFIVELIFEEIFINISQYAFLNITSPLMQFTIKSCSNSDKSEKFYNYVLIFKDNGIPFNLTKHKTILDGKKIGGCGIALVKALSKNIEYLRKDGFNILNIKI